MLLPVPLLAQIAPWGQPRPDGVWNPLMWDAMAFFYPVRLAAAEAIRGGSLPLWNPYLLSGTPLLADVQSAVLYPLNVLFWILPVERAFGILAYLHLVLAALFTVFWLRREGVSPAGSLLGAVTFAVGGWSIAWLELPNFMATAVWLPLLLGLLANTRRRHPAHTAAACALTVGMMLTAGHVQIAFYCLLGALLYAVYFSVAERRANRLLPLLIGMILGATLAAPQLLPARELSEVSHRSTQATADGYGGFLSGGQPPQHLLAYRASHLTGLAMPNLYGNPSKGAYYGLGEYSEVTAYLGLLPLLLGVHGLFLLRRQRIVGALALMGAVGLLLALGTPLNAAFYFGVPGFARFGTPGRALILFVVAWSGLVSFGWDYLVQSLREGRPGAAKGPRPFAQRPDWQKTVAITGGLLLLVFLFGVLLYPANPVELLLLTGFMALLRMAFFFALAASLPHLPSQYKNGLAPVALALTLLDLWTFGYGYNLTGKPEGLRPPPRFTAELGDTVAARPGPDFDGRILALNPSWPLRQPPRAVLPPNLSPLVGMHDVGGYEGAYLLSYKRQMNEWQGRDASPPTNGNMVTPIHLSRKMLRALAVQGVVTRTPLPSPAASSLKLRHSDPGGAWHVYEVLNPSSRAEFYRSWPPKPGETALPLPTLQGSNPNKVIVRHIAERAGYILLRDPLAPGWVSTVDGQPAPPVPTDSPVERVVKVDADDRGVEWEYRPASLVLGGKIALGGLIGIWLLRLVGRIANWWTRRRLTRAARRSTAEEWDE